MKATIMSLGTKFPFVLCLFAFASLYWQSKVLNLSLSQQQMCTATRIRPVDQQSFDDDNSSIRRSHDLRSPNEMQACDLTAVIFDPHLPVAEATSPVWGSLESVLAHVKGNVCLVLQTSSCILQAFPNRPAADHVKGEEADLMQVWRSIQNGAPLHTPHLQSALHAGGAWAPTPGGHGRVRISIVDHEVYSLLSCSNFWSPSNAWMNVKYWENEFTSQDSDMVLMVQDDTVICQTLDPSKFAAKGFAYMGGPWPNYYVSIFLPACHQMEILWRRWNGKGKVWSLFFSGLLKPRGECSFYPDNADKSEGEYYGPAGNGGLSLRSRKWMARAIRKCPHARYSGLSREDIQSASCVSGAQSFVLDVLDYSIQSMFGPRNLIYELTGRSAPEDLYFATVLRGMGAPLPSAFEASLFAAEALFPDEVATWYGPSDPNIQRQMVQELMSPKQMALAQFEVFLQQDMFWKHKCNGGDRFAPHFLPIGVHQVWHFHEPEFLISLMENNLCPHLRHVYPLQQIPQSFHQRAKYLGVMNR